MNNQFAGKQVFAKVTRKGGKFSTIHKLVTYSIAENGSMHKSGEYISCLANKASYRHAEKIVGNNICFQGRPTLAKVLEKLEKYSSEEVFI